MPEWWTYSLSDFLLFSPRTYYRMIERHNVAVWPLQIVTLGLGLGIAALLRGSGPRRERLVSLTLAALWSWVAVSFVWARYAGINWAAEYFVWLFAVEALLLAYVGGMRGRLGFQWRRDAAGALGIALFLSAVVLYPTLAPVQGRGWRQAEVFGIAPDPTVVATLGLLLLSESGPRWSLMLAPTLWCLISGATLFGLGSVEGWVLLPAALLSVGAAGVRGRLRP
jgi:Family of unknown function (DUF6064)